MNMWEYQEPDWDDPKSLREAAAKLNLRAAQRAIELEKYQRFELKPVPHNPFLDVMPEDPAVAEERERFFRTERAKQQIMDALAEDERQAEQAKAEALRKTPLARLMR
jgi:hypothetical protein